MSEANGEVQITDKPPRDLGDRKQCWVMLYEDREGGYIGRCSPIAYQAIQEDELPIQITLTDGGAFVERRLQANTIIPQPPAPGTREPQLAPIWGPPQFSRAIWPLGCDPRATTLTVPRSAIVCAKTVADLLPVIRRLWEVELQQFEALCLGVLRENAAGGPGMGRIALAGPGDLSKLPPRG